MFGPTSHVGDDDDDDDDGNDSKTIDMIVKQLTIYILIKFKWII